MEAPCAVLDCVPPQFLDCPPERLIEVLLRPTLFDLKGRDPRPLFVSVLLHGDEETGLEAVQELLRRHLSKGLSRSLLLFVGNVEAAAAGVRSLPSQRDFNRVWPGTPLAADAQTEMAQFVFDYAARRPLFASIDMHNNTGANPHYACVSRLEPKILALARLFSRTIVHSERPLGVRTAAFTKLCPAVTVECGKVGEGKARDHAVELLEACLSIAELPDHAPSPQDLNLLRSYAIVRVPPTATLSFDGARADFMFPADLDLLNFSELAAGATFGRLGNTIERLELIPGEGAEATFASYFDYVNGEIRLGRPAIPAMLTTKPAAVRQDCLCYLMHRINMRGERL